MILVDTSVWIAHFRHGRTGLEKFLKEGVVLTHPFVIGELACGLLSNREEILNHLEALPKAVSASNEEALHFLDLHALAGKSLGFIDVHLLASARLSQAPIWTLDGKLRQAAQGLAAAFDYF